MKSSRLVSILLLLQSRGRMTAAQLAGELEVSVRTVYRDVEALAAAGVPLYGDAGHAGGYRLLDGWRTRLTGMTTGEAEALFLAAVPGAAAELGLGSLLAAAQHKVEAALPPELRAHSARIKSRFHLDAHGWYADADEVPYLTDVAHAVWNRRVLRVRYRRWKEPTEVDRRLEPYGLVLKAGRWYVVSGPRPVTYRVDQMLRLDVTDEEFEAPEEFDLAGYWRRYQEDFQDRLHSGTALVRVTDAGAARLTGRQAAACAQNGRPDGEGWTRTELPVESTAFAVGEFLRLGAEVEVLGPPELRAEMARVVRELGVRYGDCG
ncbi:helix-turn-helix transcriptional regulator [Streptomyces indicus]|uniref:Predicted DNA-binding transcriptional regulator YafY, contains an HTH and WYL domains n=1 Tax=Streptomyces indicus TaxID=417292 RepID=A0A1G8UG39_9ACTN|nr:WYL domain-containing protein [Streptomyces indicus]SDJ52617.1 Predicted DNA-binding transcriptional regulator YafY, contains an HTH and WYL domains [Streptomyces indicus]